MRFISWKKKSYREHPSFLLRPPPPPHRSLIHSFVYWFIGFSPVSHVARRDSCSQGWQADGPMSGPMFCFFFSSPRLLSLFYCPLGIPNSLIYSLRSFVIFGRVSHTSVCLGNRSERPSRIVARREWGIHDRVNVWREKGWRGRRKQWNAVRDRVSLIGLNRRTEATASTLP